MIYITKIISDYLSIQIKYYSLDMQLKEKNKYPIPEG